MSNYTIYDDYGVIIGYCSGKILPTLRDNEYVLPGIYSCATQYISNGQICNYTPEELEAKENVPYGHKWAMPERQVVQDLSDVEISEYLAFQARNKRNALLKETDWVMLPDVQLSVDTQAEYALYRQALRDLPQQSGFPENITWPDLPQ